MAMRGHARHAAEQKAHAAVVLQQGFGGRENGDAACDLGHRGQKRQAAARVSHRLIGDSGAFRRHQPLGLLGIGREVQVGVEDLVLAQHLPLDLLGLLDLHDHVGVGEDRRGIGDDGRACLDERVVGEAGTEARTRLHGDLMAARHVLAYRRGRQADAVFVLLDFLGDADAHGVSSPLKGLAGK